MMFYSKLIAAIVGLLVLICSRYGLNLESQQQVIIDAITAIVTALSVYFVPNKPTTPEQVAKASNEVAKAAEDVQLKQVDGS